MHIPNAKHPVAGDSGDGRFADAESHAAWNHTLAWGTWHSNMHTNGSSPNGSIGGHFFLDFVQ